MARALPLLALLLVLPAAAEAAGWGGIEPGVSTIEQVRDRYGAPTKQTRDKVEGYDTWQWVYEESQAPAGLLRMTVDFGLLASGGYNPALVRLLKLEPKPLIFGRKTVVQGWGLPDGTGSQEGLVTFFYKEGLFIVFDKEGENATTMIFAVPQPVAPDPAAPAALPTR